MKMKKIKEWKTKEVFIGNKEEGLKDKMWKGKNSKENFREREKGKGGV